MSLKEQFFWEEITACPHFCISQTMVEGLKSYYHRQNFHVLDTIDNLLNQLFPDWCDNPENQIRQYLSISEQIPLINKPSLKSTFKFNQRELHDALRFLVELDIDVPDFSTMTINEEQKEYLRIYKVLLNRKEWQFGETKTLKEALQVLVGKSIEEIENELKKDSLMPRQRADLESETAYLSQLDLFQIKQVVFHGIHQFTPLILKGIEAMESMGIEVIYLVNYNPQFARIYDTWQKIYDSLGFGEWPCKKEIDPTSGFSLGRAVGKLLEGQGIYEVGAVTKYEKYSNLTTFCDHVSNLFGQEANENIGRMKEQFYATNNNAANDLLKAYFPAQFGEKHFLSYPIGQFILGLYNMWDAANESLSIDDGWLKECLALNIFPKEGMPKPIEIYDKLALYVSDCQNMQQLLDRMDKLIAHKEEIESKEHLADLKGFSFYGLPIEEVKYFKAILISLDQITKEIFNNPQNGYINYREHYKTLLKKIIDVAGSRYLSETQDSYVKEILERLEEIETLDVEGSIEDLKQTIHFYLNKVDTDIKANWIVRNFEQLDGAVLLSQSNPKVLHLAMVSDRQMSPTVNETLDWPLTEEMLSPYLTRNTNLSIVMNSKREYRRFLRYSLFYAAYFTKSDLHFSYVESLDDDTKESPYFLLKAIGLDVRDAKTQGEFYNPRPAPDPTFDNIDFREPTNLDIQNYALCSMRFVFDGLICPDDGFYGDFHSRFYYRSIMLKKVWEKSVGLSIGEIRHIANEVLTEHRSYFPFWKDIDFYDLEQQIVNDLKRSCKPQLKPLNVNYINMRKNFLYARLDSPKGNLLKVLHDVNNKPEIKNQLLSGLYSFLRRPDEMEIIPDKEVCLYCKFKEICLSFYEEGRVENA